MDKLHPVSRAALNPMLQQRNSSLSRPNANVGTVTKMVTVSSNSPEVMYRAETLEIFTVADPYTQTQNDELTLYVGDKVVLRTVYRDGWCDGSRIESDGSYGPPGVFPIDTIAPSMLQRTSSKGSKLASPISHDGNLRVNTPKLSALSPLSPTSFHSAIISPIPSNIPWQDPADIEINQQQNAQKTEYSSFLGRSLPQFSDLNSIDFGRISISENDPSILNSNSASHAGSPLSNVSSHLNRTSMILSDFVNRWSHRASHGSSLNNGTLNTINTRNSFVSNPNFENEKHVVEIDVDISPPKDSVIPGNMSVHLENEKKKQYDAINDITRAHMRRSISLGGQTSYTRPQFQNIQIPQPSGV
ncbi:hypothetical protein HK096_008079 [Nowakowskiella sp. JEL0078]|nr:hypothetical protein HK096_008079 [Nowakowskiella sp. JEL0078]